MFGRVLIAIQKRRVLPMRGNLQAGPAEKQFQIAAQVVNALGGDLWTLPGFGQDERALNGGLGVESEAFGGPFRLHSALAKGLRGR